MKEILFIEPTAIEFTTEEEIFIKSSDRVFTSFIGRKPPNLIISKGAKVWEVLRCGARYHHNDMYEDILPENSSVFFCDFYDIPVMNGYCKLFKRVRDDFYDYYSGSYKYIPGDTVTAIDWIPNNRIVCGNALHLTATKEQSNQWNEGGRLLCCEVSLNDMCVFPYNISQIRCRQVKVKSECFNEQEDG